MAQQPSTPRGTVAFAAAFMLVALVAFAAAFYIFDGAGIVVDAIAGMGLGTPSQVKDEIAAPAGPATPDNLKLPPGVTQEFALRLWQEQVDSQDMIRRLKDGEVAKMTFTKVERSGDEAILHTTVTFRDGTTAPGVIGMRKMGGTFFVAYASAGSDEVVRPPTGPLPALDDVDIPLLNTMLAEQVKSADISQEYVDGKVAAVTVGAVKPGLNTVTISLEMSEDHEEGYANLIAINSDAADDDLWLLARFAKTGTKPAK